MGLGEEPGKTPRTKRVLYHFFELTKWEIFTKRLYLVSLPVFFALFYDAGTFEPKIVEVGSENTATFRVADLLVPSLSPFSDWTILFPVVVAATAFLFAYEKDNLSLRSTLLNPVRSSTLFASKVVSVFLVVALPTAAAVALTIAMFDPALLLSSPTILFGNTWIWIGLYILLEFMMIAFSLLPAVLLRRPIYAFIVPVFVYFLISNDGFGLQSFNPAGVWLDFSSQLGITGAAALDWGNFLAHAYPSLILSLVCFLLSFVMFQVKDRE